MIEADYLRKLNCDKLDEMKELQENWDGEGAASFDCEFVQKIQNLLIYLDKLQPDVFPTKSGGVELEYYLGDNSLVFEINGEHCRYLITDGKSDINDIYREFEYDQTKLRDVVKAFYERNAVSSN